MTSESKASDETGCSECAATLVATLQQIAELRMRMGLDAAPEDTMRRALRIFDLHDLVAEHGPPAGFPFDGAGVLARARLRRVLLRATAPLSRLVRPEA